MKRKDLLIAGGIIGVILVLIGIGIVISPSSTSANNSISLTGLNSTDENSINNSHDAGYFFTFNNSALEAAAISVARLYEESPGPCEPYTITNTYLTSDKKYWIINMDGEGSNWTIIVDAKTLKSKSSFDKRWKPLDELKAQYIAGLQMMYPGLGSGTPVEVTLDGKKVWKVPIYENPTGTEVKLDGYVYFDPVTGKSKGFDRDTGKEGEWMTLKELDNSANIISKLGYSFRDALRNLYPE